MNVRVKNFACILYIKLRNYTGKEKRERKRHWKFKSSLLEDFYKRSRIRIKRRTSFATDYMCIYMYVYPISRIDSFIGFAIVLGGK